MNPPDNNLFCVLSINSRKSSLDIRNKIALTTANIREIHQHYTNISNLIILSTCNRIEIYTQVKNINEAKNILLHKSNISIEELDKNLVILENEAAIKHLCRVTGGLESQILGDYEIMGQVKNAFFMAKEAKLIDGKFEKIFNVAFETSKEIKNKTEISDGTTSVSFYAIHFLKKFLNLKSKSYKLTLLGLGKIGTNTLKNLCYYLPELNITVINRNDKKTNDISKQYKVKMGAYKNQKENILEADILIVATGSDKYIISKEDVINSKVKYIFDLSVPSNVDPAIKTIRSMKVINIDELSALTNETFKKREMQIPLAESIIEKQYNKFIEWTERRNQYLKMSINPIRLSSRSSELALWQTKKVANKLNKLNCTTTIIKVKSTGDLKLTQPIYQLGITGIFTKELDLHLLNNQSDLAIHSLKDVPTKLANGLCIAAVLKRDSPFDILIYKNKEKISNPNAHIATGSLRRKAQWLAKFTTHTISNIRGNIQTRLSKFNTNTNLDAIILAAAGLERMNLTPANSMILDWMIPAPAQGIIALICKTKNTELLTLCQQINHQETFICANIERNFINTLQGGCSVPIGGYAYIKNDTIFFTGVIYSFDGTQCFKIQKTAPINEYQTMGTNMATDILKQQGAKQLIDEIRNLK